MNRAVIIAAGLGLSAASASADFLGVELRTSSIWNASADAAISALPGFDGDYTVVRMYAVFDSNGPEDVVISAGHQSQGDTTLGVGLQSTSARFYQDTFGGNTSPNAGLFGSGGFAPSAEWDTFVSIGRTSQNPGAGINDATVTDPDFAFLDERGGDPGLGTNDRFLQGGWFNSSPVNGQGEPEARDGGGFEVFLSQFTIEGLTGGVVLGGVSSLIENSIFEGELTILTDTDTGVAQNRVEFVAIPTPGAAALLGFAGLATLRRRRS